MRDFVGPWHVDSDRFGMAKNLLTLARELPNVQEREDWPSIL